MGWLRVGEREEVPPGRGGQFLRVPGTQPDVCLVISHAHRVQNRRVAPEGAVLIQHSDSGAPTTNSPQTMYASCQGLTAPMGAKSPRFQPKPAPGTLPENVNLRKNVNGLTSDMQVGSVKLVLG